MRPSSTIRVTSCSSSGTRTTVRAATHRPVAVRPARGHANVRSPRCARQPAAALIKEQEALACLGKGLVLQMRGDLDRARQQYEHALEQRPGDTAARLGRASIFYAKGDYAEALRTYRELLRDLRDRCPNIVRFGIGLCLFRRGLLEQARRAFRRVLALDPQHADARIALATLALAAGRVCSVRSAAAGATRTVVLYLTLAIAVTPIGHACTRASVRHGADQRTAALPSVESLLLRRRPCPGTVCSLSLTHTRCRCAGGPGHADGHGAVAAVRAPYTRQSINFALSAYHYAPKEDKRALACYYIGRAYHARELYSEAFQYYLQSCKLNSSLAPSLFALGQIYLHREDFGKAGEYFEKVLALQPDNYEALKVLGSMLAQQCVGQTAEPAKVTLERRKRAVEVLEKALSKRPKDADVLLALAQSVEPLNAAQALACTEQAAAIYREASGTVPLEVFNNLGVFYQHLGNVPAARQALDAALGELEREAAIVVRRRGGRARCVRRRRALSSIAAAAARTRPRTP